MIQSSDWRQGESGFGSTERPFVAELIHRNERALEPAIDVDVAVLALEPFQIAVRARENRDRARLATARERRNLAETAVLRDDAVVRLGQDPVFQDGVHDAVRVPCRLLVNVFDAGARHDDSIGKLLLSVFAQMRRISDQEVDHLRFQSIIEYNVQSQERHRSKD